MNPTSPADATATKRELKALLPACSIKYGWSSAGAGPARYGWSATTAAGKSVWLGKTLPRALERVTESYRGLGEMEIRVEALG